MRGTVPSMKRWKKITLWIAGVVFVGAATFCVPTIWGKPWSVNHFYARVFLGFMLDHPMLLSQMRLLEPMGLDFHNDDLDDFSLAGQKRQTARLKDDLETLRSYDRDSLDDPLSYDVLEWFLADQVTQAEFAFHNYPVNQLSGFQSSLPDFMINTHRVDDLDGAEDYLHRVGGFEQAFADTIEGLVYRESQGIVPPKFVITRVLKEMRAFVEPPAREHILYTHFVEKLSELADVDDATRTQLQDRLADLIENSVYPAYQRMIDHYAEIEPTASTDDGVWKLPDGAALYAAKLRSFTTTQMTAEEIHQLGLSEVARIQGEMKSILQGQGYDPSDFAATMQALNREPRFLYPENDEGRAQILADYQKILDEIDAGMDPFFSLRPKAGVKVERVPEFKQETAPGAYYNPAPMDGSKPGIFYANLRSVEEIPKFGMRTLAYHEGIPGHHFQIAIAQELEGVPFFRKVVPFTAYVEGWALYAEQVAAENGFQDDPFDRLGYLTAELFRANRLVVDTGIHHKRWTREQAIDYMLANTGMPKTDVVAEIERYIVMPGQACAYKIGQLKILELRKRAQEKLGDAFDIKEFHTTILQNGALPLTLLERVVDEWIASRQSS